MNLPQEKISSTPSALTSHEEETCEDCAADNLMLHEILKQVQILADMPVLASLPSVLLFVLFWSHSCWVDVCIPVTSLNYTSGLEKWLPVENSSRQSYFQVLPSHTDTCSTLPRSARPLRCHFTLTDSGWWDTGGGGGSLMPTCQQRGRRLQKVRTEPVEKAWSRHQRTAKSESVMSVADSCCLCSRYVL